MNLIRKEAHLMRSVTVSPVLMLMLLLIAFQHVAADTTVEHSYTDRLKDAMYGFIAGCCLLLFTICMLIGTEKQAIVYDVLLTRCQQATIIINDNTSVNSLNEQKPVFLNGETRLELSPNSSSGVEGGIEKGFGSSSQSNILDKETGYRCCTKQLAIRLKRRVEMYQWVEHEKKEEKKTHYTYSLEWRESDVHSGGFQESHSHHNPPRFPPLHSTALAHPSPVKVGAYFLASEQIDKMRRYYTCPIPSSSLETSQYSGRAHVEQDYSHFSTAGPEPESAGYQQSGSGWGRHNQTDFLVFNGDLKRPQPGTVRVSYEALVERGEVSVVGVQQQRRPSTPFRPFLASDSQAREPWFLTVIFKALSGDCSCQRQPSYTNANYELDPRDNNRGGGSVCCLPCKVCCCCCYALSAIASMCSKAVVGDSVLLVEERRTTVGSMFNNERIELSKRLFAMRLIGCLLLSLSIYLIFNPIAVVLSFIPYLSGLLSKTFWFVALLIGFTSGGLIITLSWVFYRPLYFGVLSLALGFYFGPFGQGDEGVQMLGMSLVVAGILSLLLAVLYAVDAWQYSSSVEEEMSNRPVGRLDVDEEVGREQWPQSSGGGGEGGFYAQATAVPVSNTVASAPPLPPVSKSEMQVMGIE